MLDNCDWQDGQEYSEGKGAGVRRGVCRWRRCVCPEMAARSDICRSRSSVVFLQGFRSLRTSWTMYRVPTRHWRCGEIAITNAGERRSPPGHKYRRLDFWDCGDDFVSKSGDYITEGIIDYDWNAIWYDLLRFQS